MAHVWTATGSDAGAVASLMVAFRDWIGRSAPGDELIATDVRRLIADPQTEYLLGSATREAEPAGVCQLRFRHGVWHSAGDCWLEDLFVTERARGAGLGRALVERAAQRARERGCARLELDVNEANAPALALYESLGFDARSDDFGGGRNLLMRRPL